MTLPKQNGRKQSSTESRDLKTGHILLGEGLLTRPQLEEAFKTQDKLKTYKPIGQILVDQGALTKKRLNYILDLHKKRLRLGEILLRAGAVTQELLEIALEHHKKTGIRLGEALVELNFLTEEEMRQTLCTQLNVPYVNFNNIRIDRSLAKLINKNFAQKHRIVPIARMGRTMTLAMDDPTETDLIQELQGITGISINVVTSTRAAILDAFSRLYEETKTSEDLGVQLVEEEMPDSERSKYLDSHQSRRADTLVGKIIGMALNNSASDIHLETTDRRMFTRFRIDGVLQELYLGPLEEELNRLRREVVSRIKIIGKLDIAERRRPQDGSFRARLVREAQEVKIDFRISIVPGYYGENVVLRILDARNAPKSLNELGFSKRLNDTFEQLLKRNTGIILVTGPTGCGKSTTLYGALMTSYRPGIKILTAEDPIEYVYDKITQCEVAPKIGNTFAKFIRAFLRQDPEIIMVGEIRDSETAEMAFRAAQTGHLVLSTLHTNDAISSITRLLDLGVDASLLSSCLLGVISQRLVREVCSYCKTEHLPPKELLQEFFDVPPSDLGWYKGRGCSHCNHTGYSGRVAVAELWTPSQKDMILINKGASIDELRNSSAESTIFMAEDAMEKLRHGSTNFEELIRTLPFSNMYRFRHLNNYAERGAA
ncbi:MAG: Flp pilus assembly complex ATPase component TadA [Deltaproteobacteria bacterium]|nr:Flp pilus assembly complex ATPase component TadA [Deltaproteobacteria bacterium]